MKSKQKNRILAKIRNEYHTIARVLYANRYILDSNGLSENNTSTIGTDVTWSGKNEFSKTSFEKNISITQLLETLISEGQYSFLFYDYSILQIEYQIEGDKINKQRIQYIKNNNQIFSLEKMESLRKDWLSEGDQFEFLKLNEGIPFLVRVDFDPINHIDLKHAKSHMTLSNIQNCRIPLISNINLTTFVLFIMRNVYGDFKIDFPNSFTFPRTISDKEISSLHFNWNIDPK